MLKITIEQITPAAAAALLGLNQGNRAIRRARVEQSAREMADGRWQTTYEAIAVTTDGRLLNGQHRLLAIVRSGVTVPMAIARDVDPEMYRVIDSGLVRQAADRLGVKGARTKAAIARMYDAYLRVMGGAGWNVIRDLSDAQVIDVVEYIGTEAITNAAEVSRRIYAATGAPESATGAAYLLIRGLAGADDFWRGLEDGAGLDAHDPRLVLRNHLNRSRLEKGRRRDTHGVLALLLKGWRAYAKGDRVQIYRWASATEPFPAVYRP
jgi:hypothetical protein